MLCGDRWKVTGTGSRSLAGAVAGGSIPFTKLSHVCSLLSVTVSQICSLRGKMIPEELEKRVQEAKKEVRGQGEGGRRNVHVSGHGEDAGQRPGACLCVGERRGPLRVDGGAHLQRCCVWCLLCVFCGASRMCSFPGGWSLLKH